MVHPIWIIVVSAIVSAVVAKAIAAYHFKVIDSYVKDLIETAKKEITQAYISRDKR